jgi:hypothetical protein
MPGVIYCQIDPVGRIVGNQLRIRDIVKEAGAYVAVVATDNNPENYMKALNPENDWGANFVLTIERKGDKFLTFFYQLFQSMLQGTSMLSKWVELSPQIPGNENSNCPDSIMIAEAGQVTLEGRV